MKSGRTGGPPGNIFSRFVDMERPVAFLAASCTLDWHVWIFSRGEKQPGPERIASRMNFTCVQYEFRGELTTSLPVLASLLSYYNKSAFRPLEYGKRNTKMKGRWFRSGFSCENFYIYLRVYVCIRLKRLE